MHSGHVTRQFDAHKPARAEEGHADGRGGRKEEQLARETRQMRRVRTVEQHEADAAERKHE